MMLFQPHISVKVNNDMPHKDAYELVSLQIFNVAAKNDADRERVSRLWSEFVAPLFNLPIHWYLNELKDKARSEKSSHIVRCKFGKFDF